VVFVISKWLEETSETAKDILSKELEKTRDYTNKEEGNNLMRNIMHYKFLDIIGFQCLKKVTYSYKEAVIYRATCHRTTSATGPIELGEQVKDDRWRYSLSRTLHP
jgi:hypothetical protein